MLLRVCDKILAILGLAQKILQCKVETSGSHGIAMGMGIPWDHHGNENRQASFMGRNGNNQREWEGNGNKARLNLGLGMNHREWEEMGLKMTFPL